MSPDEKKKRLLDSVERYAEARESVARTKAAVMMEIDTIVLEAANPPPVAELPPKKRAPRGHKERIEARPPGRPSNKDRVLNVFKDAGPGVRVEADKVRERCGLGDQTFAYLSLLAKEGAIDRVEPGVYALKG